MAHADNLRRHFPAVRSTTYLNTANQGLIPDIAVQAQVAVLETQLEVGRSEEYMSRLTSVRKQVKAELAHVIHAAPDLLALSDGLNRSVSTVLWGLSLRAGDEVIVNSLLPPDVLLPAFIQKQQQHVKLRYIDGRQSVASWVDTLTHALTNQTRLVICPQICPVSGQKYPLEQIVKIAHQYGAAVLVDGSQAVGATPVEIDNLNVDFYVFGTNTWLCGPAGAAALYVNERWLYQLELTQAGESSVLHPKAYDLAGQYLPGTKATRFEDSFSDLTKWVGVGESLQFMRVNVGWDYAYTRIHGLSGELMDKLLDIDGVRVLTPRDARAGIVSFQVQSTDPRAFVEGARSRQIDIAHVPLSGETGGLLRVSPALYNNPDDVERLIKHIEDFTAKEL